MKKLRNIAMILAFSLTFSAFSQNADDERIIADAKEAKQKLLDKDPGLQNFFDSATGYVIFPNVGEGGFIIGAASGNGVVFENGNPVGMADLKKVDVGFQIGGQAITQVIFFETEETLNEFKTDEFTFSGEVAATAVKKGVSKNLNYNDGVIVLAMPKAGLMADVSVGGQKFSYTPMDMIDQ